MMRAIRQSRLRAAGCVQDEAGFTMVEMIIAVFIFAMVIGGVTVGMSSALNLTRQDRNRSIAANLAAQEMDTVRSTDFVDLVTTWLGTPPPTTVLVDNVPYYVSRQTEWVTPNALTGPCQATSGSTIAYVSVVVTVSWDNMSGVPAPTSSTVVTPPVGTYSALTGHIAVMVRDAAGIPQENVPVSIAGPGVSDSQVTSVDGCAFFAYEPIGAYTVTLSKSGYVDYQGVTGPSQSATVGTGTISSIQFQYDQSATLNLTLARGVGRRDPGEHPRHPGQHPLPAVRTEDVRGNRGARTVLGLFPYVDGYEMYAGSCLNADPEGVSGGAIYPGASRPAATSVTAGGTSAATVPMHTVLVQTQTLVGVPRPNVAITATNVVDTGCPTAVTYPLGTTDASGNFTAALPFGTWVFGAAGTAATKSQLLSPLVPSTPTVTIKW